MAQHFLLSAKARTLSLGSIMRMSDDEAHSRFQAIRFADNGGEPFCPHCECLTVYWLSAYRRWKCKECRRQFSVTAGTIFASRKLPVRDYLAAICIFVNAVKGVSALQLGRDLDCQYKTAFVMAHKLREAISASQTKGTLTGDVEIDGVYFGGNSRSHDATTKEAGNRQSLVVARQRGGRTLPTVVKKESDAVSFIRQHVAPGAVVHADEAGAWDRLHGNFEMKRVNHSVSYSQNGACTNQAESFFARMRRAEIGQHHRISGKYLLAYACEMGWKEDNRQVDNGAQHKAVTGMALAHPVSRVWAGYWQKTHKVA